MRFVLNMIALVIFLLFAERVFDSFINRVSEPEVNRLTGRVAP